MAIQSIAMRAYTEALKTQQDFTKAKTSLLKPSGPEAPGSAFTQAIENSLKKVNDLETQKASMIESFAAGEQQNVHELMITLQKAGLAVSMTAAVRNKVFDAYKQLMQMPI